MLWWNVKALLKPRSLLFSGREVWLYDGEGRVTAHDTLRTHRVLVDRIPASVDDFLVDGLIVLDKPIGLTSAKALYRVRRITGQRKSGHSGTLDPGASGVLVLCMGKATKLTELIMDQPKAYRARARLDVTSESFDSDSPHIPVDVDNVPTTDRVLSTCSAFEGTIDQVPPRISAVKIGGLPSYRRARGGQDIEPASRPVRIYWIHVHRYDWPEIEFEMCCGRGTYVRSLIRDLGVKLNVGGCLTSLVRTRVGPFTLQDAYTFDTLQDACPEDFLVDLDRARTLLAPERIEIPQRPVCDGPT